MFFKVKTTEEVFKIIEEFGPVDQEMVSIDKALGRILSEDVRSPEDLPGFSRSSMDGFAVQSKDTYGATESLPALLEVSGEIRMGQIPDKTLEKGKAVKISTGGMLPQGADGVVMLEHCHILDENTIEVSRSITPSENVIQSDDDYKKGATVLSKGHRFRPQDLGAMAGLGLSEFKVYRRPKVAIISTGDEVVPIDESPKTGQVRDINSHTLSAFCQQMGAQPMIFGLCKDHFEHLRALVEKGLIEADTVWISGGSSIGARDLTLEVFESFEGMEVLVHGISISPGKPTIIARMDSKAIFGLPGHTASAMVVAEVFLIPFLGRLSGAHHAQNGLCHFIDARLTRNIESASGREDYIRVKLLKAGKEWLAEPIFGKSGLISTLVDADGLLKVDLNTEGLYMDQIVCVMTFPNSQGGFS